VEDANEKLASSVETNNRTSRVIDLVDGFESSFGLELLATVHWVYKYEGAKTIDKAIRLTYLWNEGKHKFSERQIKTAFDTLAKQGWLAS
jgi:hypothetical protein